MDGYRHLLKVCEYIVKNVNFKMLTQMYFIMFEMMSLRFD